MNTAENKGFVFDAKAHLYTFDGKPLTGVTSVLGVINKPALIQWAANEAINHVKANGNRIELGDGEAGFIRYDIAEGTLEEARTAHRKKKEAAGDVGTAFHFWVEQYANGTKLPIPEGAEKMAEHFLNWVETHKVKFLANELRLYSLNYWLAGTMDFLVEVDGKKYVGDLKTSSGIYGREYFAQCAAYRMMLEEMGEKDIVGSVVVRCGKKGDFEEKYSFDYETDKKIFLAALTIYRGMATFEV